jgi:hypothetical protein
MNARYDDDALERALFALPLEEPPGDLRAAILAATVYRTAPPFSALDLGLLGTLAGVAVWLVIFLLSGAGAHWLHLFAAAGVQAARVLSNLSTLAWLALGGATAAWLTLFTGFQSWAPAPQRPPQPDAR